MSPPDGTKRSAHAPRPKRWAETRAARFPLVILIAIGLIAISSATTATADTAPARPAPTHSAPDRAKLIDLVRQDCGSCHGLTLKGGLGRPITSEALAGFDADTLALIVLDGLPGTPMPPWRPLITEAEAAAIADILKRGDAE
jgi:cytochrome c55X